MTTLQDVINNQLVLTQAQLQTDKPLLLEIQTRLNDFGLYPGGQLLDGLWGNKTAGALTTFYKLQGLSHTVTGNFDATAANALLMAKPSDIGLKRAKDRSQIYSDYLALEKAPNINSLHLAFLDKGIKGSPFEKQISNYADRLRIRPDLIEVVSAAKSPEPYPLLGDRPRAVNTADLAFLHPDVTEACVCLGSFTAADPHIQTSWFGKNAFSRVEFLSATKIIPALYVLCQANAAKPNIDIDNCDVQNVSGTSVGKFSKLVAEMVGYTKNGAVDTSHSNQVGAMFKEFGTPDQIEQWIQKITDRTASITFRGRYGELPLLDNPRLVAGGSTILSPASQSHQAGQNNRISAYDLVRFVTLLGWHHHLPAVAKLPGAQWHSLESMVRGMGWDTARYIDVALSKLGVLNEIKDPVVISKLGFGLSGLTYVVLVQFVDRHLKTNTQPSKLRTVAMALRVQRNVSSSSGTDIEVDARMAAEVTEILRRIVTEELV
jgi:hypothetical protein